MHVRPFSHVHALPEDAVTDHGSRGQLTPCSKHRIGPQAHIPGRRAPPPRGPARSRAAASSPRGPDPSGRSSATAGAVVNRAGGRSATAVMPARGGGQRHLDAVPLREPGRRRGSPAAARRRRRRPSGGRDLVRVREVLGRHPDAPVLDRDHPGAGRAAGWGRRGSSPPTRRGEPDGVLDQLGDQVRQVGDGAPETTAARRPRS